MTEKIGLIADVHAAADPVREALALFKSEGIDTILCAGDIAGYGDELKDTVDLLRESGCRAVLGNHDAWWLARAGRGPRGATDRYLRRLPLSVELTVAGKILHMVHARPPRSIMGGIRLLDETGTPIPEQLKTWGERLAALPADVLVVGHTHQVFAKRLGRLLVVNPGSTRFNNTCAILTLPDMEVRVVPLGGQAPVFSWNWGMEARNP